MKKKPEKRQNLTVVEILYHDGTLDFFIATKVDYDYRAMIFYTSGMVKRILTDCMAAIAIVSLKSI